MKYLLDTHTFLWYFEDSVHLNETSVKIIENTNEQKYISIVSLWEFSIKFSTGKLRFEGGLPNLWEMISQNMFIVLPITQETLKCLIDNLPFIHRDPFDRMIIATAITENLTIITNDENIQKYDVHWVW